MFESVDHLGKMIETEVSMHHTAMMHPRRTQFVLQCCRLVQQVRVLPLGVKFLGLRFAIVFSGIAKNLVVGFFVGGRKLH